MPIELLGAAAAVLLVLAIPWLRGGNETRRAVSVVAIIALAVVTTAVVLARSPAGQQALPPSSSLPSSVASGSPSPASSSDDAAPSVEATVVRHEVSLPPGTYSLFVVDGQGTLTAERGISFDEPSMAPVDRVEAPNGLIHWRTVVGASAGWSYIAARSGPFIVREILRLPDGSTESREVDPGQ